MLHIRSRDLSIWESLAIIGEILAPFLCFAYKLLSVIGSNRVGNTQMLFHGTKRLCQVGEAQQNVYCCKQSDCNLCCILRGSYDMERAKGSEFCFYDSFPESIC